MLRITTRRYVISLSIYHLCGRADYFVKPSYSRERISGATVSIGGPEISHLLFADDSLLFYEANDWEADQILYILRSYEEESGQMINLDKNGLYFSPSTPLRDRYHILNKFGVSEARNMEKYLGLPTIV